MIRAANAIVRLIRKSRYDTLYQAILAVFAIALLARLALFGYLVWFGGEEALFLGDSLRYLSLADSTLAGSGYMYDGEIESFRAPGYPGYFMLVRLLDIPFWLASVFQIFFSAAIAGWAVWFSARPLRLSVRLSAIIGVLVAIEPIQMYYGILLMPDVFFAVGAIVAFTCILRWFDTGLLRYSVYAGLAIGIGNFFRPAMLYLPIVLLAGMVIYALVRRTSLRHAVVSGLVILLTSFAVMSPWYIRNYTTFGHFQFISAKDYTLFVSVAASARATVEGRLYESVKQEMLARARVEAPHPHYASFENSEYYHEEAYAIIREHPLAVAKVYAIGLIAFWTSGNYQYILSAAGLVDRPSESLSYSMILVTHGPLAAISAFVEKLSEPFIAAALFDRIFWFGIFTLSLAGILVYLRSSVGIVALIFYAYFSATILSVAIGVEARYRYALNPIMLAFSLAALHYAYSWIKRRKT